MIVSKKMLALLRALYKLCGTTYKVVEKDEILELINPKFAYDKDNLVATLKYLEEKDLVSIKYDDKEDICVKLTSAGEGYFLEADNGSIDSGEQAVRFSKKMLVVVMAFAAGGAFVGTMVAQLILLLIK